MASEKTLVYFGTEGTAPPEFLRRFEATHGLELLTMRSREAMRQMLYLTLPACVVLDATRGDASVLRICREIKEDAFRAIVPLVLLARRDEDHLPLLALEAGADEVLTDDVPVGERSLRLGLVISRWRRDVNVNPLTRLPGRVRIELDIRERLAAGEEFAVCYADLDHFKEFNDRYGYRQGDAVILLLSRILRDVIRSLAPGGFVGHLGGDDFLFNVKLEHVEGCCFEILELFDELVPYQYSEDDRVAGHFLGRDRRGALRRVPIMSLSIGVVSNRFRSLTRTARIVALSAEMKNCAKSRPGSVHVVDPYRPKTDHLAQTIGTIHVG